MASSTTGGWRKLAGKILPHQTFQRENFGLAEVLRWLALAALGGAILFAPFRYHFVLFRQPLPPIYEVYTDIFLYISDIFLVSALLAWGASLVLKPAQISAGPLFISIPLASLILTSALGAPFSASPTVSIYHVIRFLLLGGLYLFVINEVKTLGVILWAVAGGVFIQAGIAIMQILGQRSLGLQALGEIALDPSNGETSIVWGEGVRSLRAYGLTDHPNILGGTLAFSLLLIGSWYIARGSGRQIIGVSVFMLGALALLLTYSNSAWLAMVAGVTVIIAILIGTRQKEPLGKGVYLTIASLIISAPFIWQNASLLVPNPNDPSHVSARELAGQEQSALNQAANQVFSSNAVTGVGLGSFPIALQEAQPDFAFNYQPPHNVLLTIAAETGLFGALFYFTLLVGPWLMIRFKRKQLDFSVEFIGVTGALAALTLVSFIDYYPWFLAPGRFWQWLLWGLWGAFYQLNLGKRKDV